MALSSAISKILPLFTKNLKRSVTLNTLLSGSIYHAYASAHHDQFVYWIWTTTTTIVLRPFVRDYPGEPVPEETFTHPPSWSSSSLYQLLLSTTIHGIRPVQIMCLAIFLHNLFPCPLFFTEFEMENILFPFGGNLSFLTTCVQNLKTLLQPFQRFEGNPKRKIVVI